MCIIYTCNYIMIYTVALPLKPYLSLPERIAQRKDV